MVPSVRAGPIRGSVALMFEEPTDRTGVEMFGDPEGPTERPTALCHVETSRIGMQPRSPAGEATPGIRGENPGHGHDAQ